MRAALIAAVACLLVAGCAKKAEELGGPVPPATPEAANAATTAMWQSQFDTHKEQWERVLAGPDTPLPEDKVEGYAGLRFFPYDPALRYSGDLERMRPPRDVELPDNRGKMQTNLEYGRYGIVAAGDTAWLTVYRPLEHPEQFFIPFRDSTSGGETYGGGRYVHLDSMDVHRFVLDFNKAYNPYCAFDARWICPLPPAQNTLPFSVRAGMMTPPEVGE